MADICGVLLEDKSEYNDTLRKMPSDRQIKEYWKNVDGFVDLVGFDSVEEFCEDDYCFACGFTDGKLDRAHILARALGGSDFCSNLHLLCRICHKDSEHIYGENYKNWIIERHLMDKVYSTISRTGINLFSLLNKNSVTK